MLDKRFFDKKKIYRCDLTEYINRPGHNKRPVLVIDVDRSKELLTIYNIQSLYDDKGNKKNLGPFDCIITDWTRCGLDHESYVTTIPLEIGFFQVIEFLGVISSEDYNDVRMTRARAERLDIFFNPESFLNWAVDKKVQDTDPKDGVSKLNNKIQSANSITKSKKMNHVDAAFTIKNICENSTKIHSFKLIWMRWKFKPSLDSGHLLCMFTRKTKIIIHKYIFVWTGNYKTVTIIGPIESEEEALKLAFIKALGKGYLGSAKEYYEFKDKDYNLMNYYLEYDITVQRDFLERIINNDTKFERISN